MGKIDNEILKLLNETPLTLIEIAEKLEKKPKVVFRSLRKLFQKGKIGNDPRTRRYMLINEEGHDR
jgi:DNA-binding IclR family transcriptional regulator